MKSPKLIVAGGGTGGHILPGVSVADAWKKMHGETARVAFVGARGALEERLVPRAGYPLWRLWIGGLNRVNLFTKLRTLALLPVAFLQSALILLWERPAWVIGVGGYSSGPFVLTAATFGKLFGVKTAILEPNSVPGMSNRKLARFVDRVFVSFQGARKYFSATTPDDRMTFVGTPVRKEMRQLPSAPRRPFTVFIFGGSQGAVGMNTIVIEALPGLKAKCPGVEFIHQTGKADLDRVRQAHEAAGTIARVEPFIDDMISCYARASLIICRSGASTLAEIAAVGRAAILVPLPTAADNHQVGNAQEAAATGGAVVVEQGPEAKARLVQTVVEAFENHSLLNQMEVKIRSYFQADSAVRIVQGMPLHPAPVL